MNQSYKLIRVDGVAISTGNTKLGAIPSVSLVPWFSCNINGPRDCMRRCYARKLARLRPCVSRCWESNSRIWAEEPSRYFDAIRTYLAGSKPARFRWHVAGDIPNVHYLAEMTRIAKEFPSTRFLCFTKSYNIAAIIRSTPENLTIRVSAWPGPRWAEHRVTLGRALRLPVAWVLGFKETDSAYRLPEGKVSVCPDSCLRCDWCWRKDVPHVGFKAH